MVSGSRKHRKRKSNAKKSMFLLVVMISLLSYGIHNFVVEKNDAPTSSEIPEWSGEAYVSVNGGKPDFKEKELSTARYERHEPLDEQGRATGGTACLDKAGMAKGQRDYIGMIRPTGWHYYKYNFIKGRLLYNRCHLIGWQLTGSTADRKNLVTGTRYMNVKGMLPWENRLADYLRKTEKHVMYRVTPIYKGKEALCRGVKMEAMSVEDKGKSLSFNVYCHNVQPGVKIDYATGESEEEGDRK